MDISSLPVPVILYAGLNILAFAVFSYDKFRAKMMMGRRSETSLLLVAALGPLGALTAMILFRHKTHHLKFILVPLFFILHLILFIWLWPQAVL
ncbi:MAG: DUF1294 domain-containing protein [Methanoregula sp.]|jgi:uncharacterized membrane protein YsdA (DUF1294 family)|nr:DUF1294 domain-containing protein [Methanoregula sp.]